MNFKEAVDRGIKFLDYFHPGWKEKIDVDELDMDDNECCILGQLYGDYCENPLEFNQCYNYGFTGSRVDMSELTKEWKSRLVTRFNLSKDEVGEREYIVVESYHRSFTVGDKVKIVIGYGNELLPFLNKNLVMKGSSLFVSPNIVVVETE